MTAITNSTQNSPAHKLKRPGQGVRTVPRISQPTGSRSAFYLTGAGGAPGIILEPEQIEELYAEPLPEPPKLPRAQWFKDILDEAILGGPEYEKLGNLKRAPENSKKAEEQENEKKHEEEDNEKTKKEDEEKRKDAQLTTAQLEIGRAALDAAHATYKRQKIEENGAQITKYGSIVPVNINGDLNFTNNPVFFQSKRSTSARVPHLPYAVSESFNQSRSRPSNKDPEAHRKHRTSVSLCAQDHVRLSVHWDVQDAANRIGTWDLSIDECFSAFNDPEAESAAHETSSRIQANSTTEPASPILRPCNPLHPSSKIPELARKMVEDYTAAARNRARISPLAPRGWEYTLRQRRWGGKDPFTPGAGSDARAAYEFGFGDGGVWERELRVLVAMWFRMHKKGVGIEGGGRGPGKRKRGEGECEEGGRKARKGDGEGGAW